MEIKPCPFCGSENVRLNEAACVDDDDLVECNWCGAAGPAKTKEEAVAAWNRVSDAVHGPGVTDINTSRANGGA